MIGLSNASRTTLLHLNSYADLRWRQVLSSEEARTYKPDPAVYQLAVTMSGRPPERLLMVAAHAWDLRGAQSLGLRTAYVARPRRRPARALGSLQPARPRPDPPGRPTRPQLREGSPIGDQRRRTGAALDADGYSRERPIRCTVTTFRGDLNRMNYEIGDLSARSENEPQ